MTQEFVLKLGKEALLTALLVSSPMLLIGLVVGVLVGIFQAVTQIQEVTLTFVPKMLIMAVAFIVLLPWMLDILITFTANVLGNLSTVAH